MSVASYCLHWNERPSSAVFCFLPGGRVICWESKSTPCRVTIRLMSGFSSVLPLYPLHTEVISMGFHTNVMLVTPTHPFFLYMHKNHIHACINPCSQDSGLMPCQGTETLLDKVTYFYFYLILRRLGLQEAKSKIYFNCVGSLDELSVKSYAGVRDVCVITDSRISFKAHAKLFYHFSFKKYC